MRTALITIVHGRHDHLRAQAAAVRRSEVLPDLHVVVAMGDSSVRAVLHDAAAPALPGQRPPVVPEPVVVELPLVPLSGAAAALPLAAARNAGAARAVQLGAELLVLLDVDCLPAPGLIGHYVQAAQRHRGVLCGPVGYLPAPPEGGYPEAAAALARLAAPHAARPVPPDGQVLPAPDVSLFWSLSFAVRADDWARIGGFDESYYGYGAEDTDFGQRMQAADVPMWWVGGATAYHQHHGSPAVGAPVQHVDDVLRNGRIFRERWGWWPMRGWLEQYERLGLVRATPCGDWHRVPA